MHDSTYFNTIALKIPAIASGQSGLIAFIQKQLNTAADTLLLNPSSAGKGVILGIFLVSVPVFFEAPLVRTAPWLCVLLTGAWVWGSHQLRQHARTTFAGELCVGLSWSWLAGAIYWGWFRWEPLWHIPIEAIGLPVALWGLYRGWHTVGHWFYLGSLLGTAVTDLYFYRLHLMPSWRAMMVALPSEAISIVQTAFAQVQTLEGVITAAICASFLLALAWSASHSRHRHHWIFSGTLVGTLLVDGLFVVIASLP
jgi:hypothetical protein